MKLLSISSLIIVLLTISYFTSTVVGQNLTQKRQEMLEKFRSRPKDGLPANFQDLVKKHSDRIKALNNETHTRNKSSSFTRKQGRNLKRYSSYSENDDDLFEDGRIAGVIIGAFSGFFLLMTSCCWCAQCQKHSFQNGVVVLKCKCHRNRLCCKKRTPRYRKVNSEFAKATQRGVVGLPNQEIMRQVALNNPVAHQMVMGTAAPIIMGQPGLYQPGYMPNPALGNMSQPMVMHGNPLYPPTYNQNAYGQQQMGPDMQPMNMMMQPPQNMQYPGNNTIQPTNMNDYQHMNNQNAMYQIQQQMMQQPQHVMNNQMDQNQSQMYSHHQVHDASDNKLINQ